MSYRVRNERQPRRIWLEAWRDALGLLDKGGLSSIRALDERFRGPQSPFNWIQDLEDELWNAGLEDPQFLTARIAACEEGLRCFPTEDDLIESRRRASPESCFELGETGKDEADELRKEAKRSVAPAKVTRQKVGRPCGSGRSSRNGACRIATRDRVPHSRPSIPPIEFRPLQAQHGKPRPVEIEARGITLYGREKEYAPLGAEVWSVKEANLP